MYKEYNRVDKKIVTTHEWDLYKNKVGVLYGSDDYSISSFYRQFFRDETAIDQSHYYQLDMFREQLDNFFESIFNLPTVVLSQTMPCVNYGYALAYNTHQLSYNMDGNEDALRRIYRELINPNFLMFIKHIRFIPLKNKQYRLEIHGVHHRLIEEEDFLEAQLINRIDTIENFLSVSHHV